MKRQYNLHFGAGIIISAIFFVYSKEIGYIFYKTDEIAFYIKYLSPLIPFMYLESAIAGMMQGLNQQKKALKYNIFDSIIRISSICLILPRYGIKGFLFIMYVSNITTSMLNMIRLVKVSKAKFDFDLWLLKPLLAAFASITFEKFLFQNIIIYDGILNIILKVIAIVGCYFILLVMFGIIEVRKIFMRKKKI